MASVLFSTVGQALGGPLGAAVGIAVGSGVDAGLFGRRQEGVTDLFVQRSAYGEIVPRIYGRTRTSGHLIWALAPGGRGGKGGGRQAIATSMAIALSSGPIVDIGRIWADGREIRNADGQFEATTTMRIHHGGQGQQADPLIVAAEGEDTAPGYRDFAYVVFEELDLAPFGNRIPNLSFEVIADHDGPRQWLEELGLRSGIKVDPDGNGVQRAVGYSAVEKAVVEAGVLGQLGGLELCYADGIAEFAASARTFAIGWDEVLLDSRGAPELQQTIRPSGVAFSYLDPERDYQAGRQRVGRGRRGMEVESSAPVCATAGMALSLAGRQLRQLEARAETITFGLSWKWLCLAVGDRVTISGRGPWRIVEREIRGMRVFCRAEKMVDTTPLPLPDSDPGRGQTMPMVPAGPTEIRLIEPVVPLVAGNASLYVWLGGGAGWKGATARQLVGGNEVALGAVRETSTQGRLLEALAPGPEAVWDFRNSLLLTVEPGLPFFESRSAEEVLAGANLVLVGDELLQYCDAVGEGDGVVRLSRLLRGRFGTNFSPVIHAPGTDVIQITPGRLLPVNVPTDAVGRELVILASGAGDPVGGTEQTKVFEGLHTSPMAPVHVRAERLADGSIRSRWIARSREMWGWNSPESTGWLWRWKFRHADAPEVVLELAEPQLVLGLAEQIALFGTAFGSGVVTVEAVGEGPIDLRTVAVELF